MVRGEHFEIEAGRLVVHGVSFGYGDSNPYVISVGKRHILVRCPGVHEWSSRGESMYHPARYILFAYERGRVKNVLKSISPGIHWRKAKSQLQDEFVLLEAMQVES